MSIKKASTSSMKDLTHVTLVAKTSRDDEAAAISDAALLRKLDRHILPAFTILYLMSFLDRGNIGNAVLFGLKTDLHLVGQQFNIALAIFYVCYVVIEAPANALLKRWSPRPFITLVMFLTGIAGLSMGFVKNFSQLSATRALLGIFEGGLYPGLMFCLSCWYKREEASFRACMMFAAASGSGAFGGLLARAIKQMDGLGGKSGWEWIFIIESLITLALTAICYPWVADTPEKSNWLSEEEKKIVIERRQATDAHMPQDFQWRYVWHAVFEWKVWVYMLMELGSLTSVLAFSNFAPSIVAAMGFKAGNAQLLTVPPYVLGCLMAILVGWLSDKQKTRFPYILLCQVIAMVGYAIMLATTVVGARYLATCLICIGSMPLIPLEITWNANNAGGSLKRAIAIAMQIGCANLGGITGSFTYRAQDAPKYILGHATMLGFMASSAFFAIVMYLYIRYENARRDRVYGTDPLSTMTEEEIALESEKGDRARWFRYIS